jgi:hypothetical protein
MKRAVFVFLCGGLVGAAVLLLDFERIISHFMVDDSFYYFEIARNLALGNGPTFDGLHRTNGFQPLFQYALVPVYWLVTDLVKAVFVIKGFEAVLFGGICLMMYRVGERLGSPAGGLLAAAFVLLPGPDLHPFGRDLMIGMESGLNALFFLVVLDGLLDFLENRKNWTRRRYPVFGLALGMLFLARVDNALLILGIVGVMLGSLRREEIKDMFILLLVAALTAGIYLAWNWQSFDSLLPISGSVKLYVTREYGRELWAADPAGWFREGLWYLFTFKPIALLPLGGLLWYPALLGLEYLRARWLAHLPQVVQVRPALLMLWLTGAARVLAYGFLLQLKTHRFGWYYVPEIVMIALSAGLVGRSLLGAFRPQYRTLTAMTALGLAAVLSLTGILRTTPEFEWESASYAAVPVIDALTPNDAVLGAKDAGVLGYFLPNPVVNLDGLVNDGEFFAVLRQQDYAEYIDWEGIAYLANLLEPGSGSEDLFVSWLGAERLELLYQSDHPAESADERVYKLYRVVNMVTRSDSQ